MVLKHLHTTAQTEKHNFTATFFASCDIILAPTYTRSRYEESVPDLLEMPAKLFFSSPEPYVHSWKQRFQMIAAKQYIQLMVR